MTADTKGNGNSLLLDLLKLEKQMHDYQKPTTGWCGDPRRGAAMGRSSDRLNDEALMIRRVPIDDGGYDPGGTYWGIGYPLFCVIDMQGSAAYLKAENFEEAKKQFPNTTWLNVIVDGDIEDMVQAFAECALFMAEDDDGSLGDRFTISDFSKEAMTFIKKICNDFVSGSTFLISNLIEEIDVDWSRLGHDLYLGDFSGHWPSEWIDALDDARSPKIEYLSVYVGDDRQLYIG